MDKIAATLETLGGYIEWIEFMSRKATEWHRKRLQGNRAAYDLVDFCVYERICAIYNFMDWLDAYS